MSGEETAPGLRADWLNGWLAAIGATVLVPGLRLAWTDEPVPAACFAVASGEPAARVIGAAFPTVEDIGRLAIARHVDGTSEFPRTVTLDAYRDRARLERQTGGCSLAASVTDLTADPKKLGNLPHSPFDPPMPQGITLWQRLQACRATLADDPGAAVEATLSGRATRVDGNGLGFDYRRLGSGVQPKGRTGMLVDPVVETLAFFGIGLFPARGGSDGERFRGWTLRSTRRGAFRWPVWAGSLDRWAIDALLDQAEAARGRPALCGRLGIHAWYQSVPYAPLTSADVTRAYASERARP